MRFITRNEDVFMLSGSQVICSDNLAATEHRTKDDCPVLLHLDLQSPTGGSGAVDVTWRKISQKKRERGDLVDVTIALDRGDQARAGDILDVRFPFDPEAFSDPDFALTAAASFQIEVGGLPAVEMGLGSGRGLHFALPVELQSTSHFATGWKPGAPVRDPSLTLRFHLDDTPFVKVRIGKLFVGYDYDPYVFSPPYEYRAHLGGRPSFPGGAEVLAEFEHQARLACKTNRFLAMQSFIKPFLVMREGKRRFPMLIGTPNAISWYALDPYHGIETYEDSGWVRPGDVSLDCGAHAGQMSAFFGLVGGKSGKVIAFDPFPQNYLQVEAQGRLNGLENLVSARAGVGPAAKTISLSNLHQKTTDTSRSEIQGENIDVRIVPLDDYIDLRPNFIKLDVEGAEVGALYGARQLMARCRPRIFTELHTQFLGEFGHSVKDFFDAIPRSLYRVFYRVEGVDSDWREYADGDHARFTAPGLVFAEPR